jgi:hypothetical protein
VVIAAVICVAGSAGGSVAGGRDEEAGCFWWINDGITVVGWPAPKGGATRTNCALLRGLMAGSWVGRLTFLAAGLVTGEGGD